MKNSPVATRFIDSHTGGEPTRVVIEGGPQLGTGTMEERLRRFRVEHDAWRKALVNEPRGSDVLVGALLLPPEKPDSDCGVIFFNNVGYLGMCGHGTIGLVATLAHLGRISAGEVTIDTPVGTVRATLSADGSVMVANIASYRFATDVPLDLPDGTRVHGDIAWGGNWFFLCADHGLSLAPSNIPALTARAQMIRQTLQATRTYGADSAEIDHVELTSAALDPANSGRNFVLCPGMAYDRSPCGTGTSAKLACLAADSKLAPGQPWLQESVIGSVFRAHYKAGVGGQVLPFIEGNAYVTVDATMIFDERDPFAWGFSA